MTDPRNIGKSPEVADVDGVAKVTYDAAIGELRDPSHRWDVSHHGPARDVKVAALRLLRGRVLLRVLPEVQSELVLIDTSRTREDSVGRGEVVAMGLPAETKRGVPIPPQFKVGDTVLFVGQHKSRQVEIEETLQVVAQEEVQAVIE